MKPNRGLIAILALVILLGVAVRVLLAMLPIETLIGLTLYDDAFYYFEVAQHLLAGGGSSFDGANLTNGYHPLWMAASLLAFAATESSELSIRLLLLLALALELAAVMTVGLLAYRLTGAVLVMPLLAAVWLWNPRILLATANGMETAASVLAVALVVLAFYHTLEQPSPHRAALFGVSGGLAMLARTDNVLLFGLLLVLLLLAVRRSFVLLSVPLAAVLVAPWVIWNWIPFQSIVQDSALAPKGMRMALLASTEQSLASFTLETLAPMYALIVGRMYALTGLPVGPYAVLTLAWLAVAAMAVRPYLRGMWNMADSPRRWLVVALLLWPLLFIAVHVFWRWSFRSYYHAATFISVLIPYAVVLFGLVKSPRVLKRGILVALVPLMLVSYVQSKDLGLLHHQREMLRAVEWLNAACADRATCPTVGSFNAGILGFFYRGRVVNLDGVINRAAVAAIHERALWSYVEREGICYLADFRSSLQFDHPVWGWRHPPESVVVYEHRFQSANRTSPIDAMGYVIYQLVNQTCSAATVAAT